MAHVPASSPLMAHVPTSSPLMAHVPTSSPLMVHVPTSSPLMAHVPTSSPLMAHIPTSSPLNFPLLNMLIFLLYNSKGNEVEEESYRVKARRLWLTWRKKDLFSFASILPLFLFLLSFFIPRSCFHDNQASFNKTKATTLLSYSLGHQVTLRPAPSHIKFCWRRITEKPGSSRN